MRLVGAAAVPVGVWIVGTTVLFLVTQSFATIERLESTSGQLVWFALPQLVLSFAMVALAGLVCGRSRLSTVAAHLAVLTFPVAQLVTVTVLSALGETPTTIVAARLACGLVGLAVAWFLVAPRPLALLAGR